MTIMKSMRDVEDSWRCSLRPVVAWLLAALWASLMSGGLLGCSASGHATRTAALGEPIDLDEVDGLLAESGPIAFERIHAANWSVSRAGLIDLDHPRAEEAGIEDGSEPIEIYFYLLEHPQAGDFIVDSGVETRFRSPNGSPAVATLVESVMKTRTLEIETTTAEWLARRGEPLAGVFLTHVHLDHVMGLPDIPLETPVYVGPGETTAKGFLHAFTRGTIDRMFEGRGALEVWPVADPGDVAEEDWRVSAVDVFGDRSLIAFHVPGHTPGSMAFLVRATDGPRLLVGDTSHTRWGWENDVPSGQFTLDRDDNVKSLAWLRALAKRHPAIEVHLGHQRLGP